MKTQLVKVGDKQQFMLWDFQRGRKWYWHLTARNGRVVADHQQGYNHRTDMHRVLSRVFGVPYMRFVEAKL